MNFGINVSYVDIAEECRACGDLHEVTAIVDHQTDILFWECPNEDCRYENVRWVEDV